MVEEEEEDEGEIEEKGELCSLSLCDTGRRLTEATEDQPKTFWLMQSLSLAVQRGNAVGIICSEKKDVTFEVENLFKSFRGLGR